MFFKSVDNNPTPKVLIPKLTTGDKGTHLGVRDLRFSFVLSFAAVLTKASRGPLLSFDRVHFFVSVALLKTISLQMIQSILVTELSDLTFNCTSTRRLLALAWVFSVFLR